MAKLVRTLRNHWKKSIFFGGVAAYGLNYAKNKFNEKQMMKEYCKEALAYGEPAVPVSYAPYHVTVVLNPAACGGKGRVRFETYCAPLLHLAGIKVSVIRTEGEGQAKNILEVVENCDAVLIAGGDGTLMEAITGWMRRQSNDKFKVPIGILPVGSQNLMARNLFPTSQVSEVRLMADATMSVVRQLYQRPMSVIEVENLSHDESGYAGKKIYGFRHIQTGAFRDAEARMSRYWYFAGLKKYLTYVFSYTTSAKEIYWSVTGNFETPLEPEVSPDEPSVQQTSSDSWSSWLWQKVVGGSSASPAAPAASHNSMSLVSWVSLMENFNGSEFIINSGNDQTLMAGGITPTLTASFGPENPSFKQFVSEGWRRQRSKSSSSSLPDTWKKFEVMSIKWTPGGSGSDVVEDVDPDQEEDVTKSKSTKPKRERMFYVDNESIEVHGPMRISLLSDQFLMFCSPETFYPFQRPDEKQAAKKWWRSSGFAQSNRTQMSVAKTF